MTYTSNAIHSCVPTLPQVTGRRRKHFFLDVANEDKEKAKAAETQGRKHISMWPSRVFQLKTRQYLEDTVFFASFLLFQGLTPVEKICYQENYEALVW